MCDRVGRPFSYSGPSRRSRPGSNPAPLTVLEVGQRVQIANVLPPNRIIGTIIDREEVKAGSNNEYSSYLYSFQEDGKTSITKYWRERLEPI